MEAERAGRRDGMIQSPQHLNLSNYHTYDTACSHRLVMRYNYLQVKLHDSMKK